MENFQILENKMFPRIFVKRWKPLKVRDVTIRETYVRLNAAARFAFDKLQDQFGDET